MTEISERQVPVVFSSHQLDLVERLCDSLAIIAGGRIAAAGPLAEVSGGKPLAETFREATRGDTL
jgi:ABC-2 type transport system ATP-binding protein